jgi:hypothetical protein
MLVEFVREGLLHIKESSVRAGRVHAKAVQNLGDVGRLVHTAVEVRAQPIDIMSFSEFADANEAFVIPCCVSSSELYLEGLEPVRANPVVEEHGHSIVGLGSDGVVFGQRIQPPDEVPNEE